MKLRFKVDQGEASRRGDDAPTSVVTIEINPKTLTHEERNLLADRMVGIDVFKLHRNPFHNVGGPKAKRSATHIVADSARLEALMSAIWADEAQVQGEPENTIIVGDNGKVIWGQEHFQRISGTGVTERLKVIFGWPQKEGRLLALRQSETTPEALLFDAFPMVTPEMARQVIALGESQAEAKQSISPILDPFGGCSKFAITHQRQTQ